MAQQSFIAYWPNSDNNYGIEARCTSVLDAENNRSEVTVEVILHHWEIWISKRNDGDISIDGSKTTYATAAIDGESTDEPVATRTVIIDHDTDGSKSVDVSASFNYRLDSKKYGRVGRVTAGGTFVLDTIARASTIADQTKEVAANGTDEWFIRMNRASDKFRHIATITIGDTVLTTNPFGDELRMAALPNLLDAGSAMHISVQTYSDESCSTPIGDPVTTTIAIKVPDDSGPICKGEWCAPAYGNVLFGEADEHGNAPYAVVQGYSYLEIRFNPSLVEAQYGATLDKFRVELEGKSYECSATPDAGGKCTIITKVFAGHGALKYNVYAVDSRGTASRFERDCTVEPYERPRLYDITVYRCDRDGVAESNGTCVYAKADAAYSECKGINTISIIAYINNAIGTGPGIASSAGLTPGTGTVIGLRTNGVVDPKKSYVVDIIATDEVGNTVKYSTTIPTDDISFHIRGGGKGAAFGKYAEEQYDGYVDFDWKVMGRKGFFDGEGRELVIPKMETGGISNSEVTGDEIRIAGANFSGSTGTYRVARFSGRSGLYLAVFNVCWAATGEHIGSARVYISKNNTEIAAAASELSFTVDTAQNLCAFVNVVEGENVDFLASIVTTGNVRGSYARCQLVKIGG